MANYNIKYEALAYNLPFRDGATVLDHIVKINYISKTDEDLICNNKNHIFSNPVFLSCILTDENNKSFYTTVQSNITISTEKATEEVIIDAVREKIHSLNKYLFLITNIHIFFPVISIDVNIESTSEKFSFISFDNQPYITRDWLWFNKKIDIKRRMEFNFDFELFKDFINDKKHNRFNKAFQYYIDAFSEKNHAMSFCLLCSSIDAITGKGSKLTKERLSKYSSILFCEPTKITEYKNKMKEFYKLRSDYIHGKGSEIAKEDEFELREYVRKFLISYYLFWKNMNIKNEPQMLQKLDDIYNDPKLYMQYAPSAYMFISLMNEHEQRNDGILNIDMNLKGLLAFSKIFEALSSERNHE